MIGTRKLRLDRITSSTLNARLKKDVIVGPEIVSREGCIVAVRVLTDKRVYNQVEDVSALVPKRAGVFSLEPATLARWMDRPIWST